MNPYDLGGQPQFLAAWMGPNLSGNAALATSLRTMRNRSRGLARNNSLVSGWLSHHAVSVVGAEGIRLLPQAVSRDGAPDDRARRTLKRLWQRWGKVGSATVCGQYSIRDALILADIALNRDGEILIKPVVGESAGNAYEYALQIIEIDHLDDDYSGELPDGRRVFMGVECADSGRPTAYYLLSHHPGDTHGMRGTRERVRVPASDIIHLALRDRPGQLRGVPQTHSAAVHLHSLGQYVQTELAAARFGSQLFGFMKTDASTGMGHPGDDAYERDADGAKKFDLAEMGGSVLDLPPGRSFEGFRSEHPTTAFSAFVESQKIDAARGLGSNYADLTGDASKTNYSALRHMTAQMQYIWKDRQNFLIEHLLEPVFDQWLDAQRDREFLPPEILNNPSLGDVRWLPRGWADIDPIKAAKGRESDLALGLTSRTRLAAERGHDFAEILAERAAEQEAMVGAGLMPVEDTSEEEDEEDIETDEEEEDDVRDE